MIAWILCERATDGTLTPIGIFAAEDGAKAAAIDGQYAAIPVEIGSLYSNIVSMGMTGVSLFSKSGEQTRLDVLETKADQILSRLDTITTRLNGIDNDLTSIHGDLDQARSAILDLRSRVEALENPE